jgi:DNA-binding CsgD family transcriptional regulator
MDANSTLDGAREAFRRQAWSAARVAYANLGSDSPLTLDDLEQHAVAAHLVGEDPEFRHVLARGYREAVSREDVTRAVRFAFWLGESLISTGEMGQAGGWLSRARGLLEARGVDCVEWGFLMVLTGIEQFIAGDTSAACRTFTEAQAIGRRFADPDLPAMAGHGRGRALIRTGSIKEGMTVLDEVMVAVTTGEVSPMVVGVIYCGVLEACCDVFDLGRAREWTAAMSRWCDGQSDLMPFRGVCLIHRVEVMRLHGDWEDALDEARRARDWLSHRSSLEGPGAACYEIGELHRLRGNFSGAESAFRDASRLGRPPEPGLALLWLARGHPDVAALSVRRALDELGENSLRRADLLSACVEILLRLNDVAGAQDAAEELEILAKTMGAPSLHALADRAQGSVLIAKGDARAALALLRRSWTAWQQLDVPYEAAMTRVLIGAACRGLGDGVSAEMEFDAARWAFERLGAAPDVTRLAALLPSEMPRAAGGLTSRELEVLALVAAGETNKGIAAALVISEHTVARHVQNMFRKLGFASRASLAAFAVEEGLAHRSSGQN